MRTRPPQRRGGFSWFTVEHLPLPLGKTLLVAKHLGFLAVMAFLGLSLTDPPSGAPGLGGGITGLAVGGLGSVVNPLWGAASKKFDQDISRILTTTLSFLTFVSPVGIGVWAAIEVFRTPSPATAQAVLVAAVAGFSGLSLDTSNVTHPDSQSAK
ncbi:MULTISPECIES: hypothetical protein [Kitasatospora]|uniref:Uncharacterized protein n=1 Tax=Kitasatospora cystarginea TaxID=58350 RepID=A0ABP5RR47_9ACTN